MKKINFLLILTCFVSNAYSATTLLGSRGVAEKCYLFSSKQEAGNSYDALLKVKSINLFGEMGINNLTSDANGNVSIPKQIDTLVTFNFDLGTSTVDGQTSKYNIGDEFFKTNQSITFKSANGKVIDLKQISGDKPWINVYTHSFEQQTKYSTLKMVATHEVVQVIDHWYSKDVTVNYEYRELNTANPKNAAKRVGSFVFRCEHFAEAIDTLKGN